MTTFVGSPNSRYYVGVRGDTMFFTKEDVVAWEKKIPFEVFQIVAIGGNGNVFVRAPEGIYVYDPGGRELHSPIARWSRKALTPTSSQLASVKVSADGRTLCVERSTLQTRLSQKIFEFLSSNKVEANTTIHEIFFHNVNDDTDKSFYRCMSSTKSPQKFLWDISVDFMWIVLAEPEKNGSQIRFSVAHVPSQTIYHEFAIPNIRIRTLKVSRDGTALVDVSQNNERAIIMVTLDSVKYNLTVPSMDYEVRHIGKDFVAIMTQTTPFLLIKGFDDRLKSQADLRSLQRLQIDYDVSFNERDALDLISLSGNQFKVLHTNVEFLETDARRWEQLADTREAEVEAENAPPAEPERPKVYRPQKLELEASSRPVIQPMIGVDGLAPGVPKGEGEVLNPGIDRGIERALPLAVDEESPTERRQADRREGERRQVPEPPAPAPAPAPPRPPAPRREAITHIPIPTRQATPADNGTAHAAPPPEPKVAPPLPSAGRSRAKSTPAMPSAGRSKKAAEPAPAPAAPSPAAPSPAAAPPVAVALDETERRRIQRLLELLEERFMLGQVSESTYADLKAKYTARLGG